MAHMPSLLLRMAASTRKWLLSIKNLRLRSKLKTGSKMRLRSKLLKRTLRSSLNSSSRKKKLVRVVLRNKHP